MEKHIMPVRTKMPQPRRNYIARKRLNESLNEILDHKLIVIKGSAGSGKTTLITSYLTAKAALNVKWITLDGDCNDLFLFWDYIISVLSEFIASNEFIEYFNGGISRENLRQIIGILVGNISEEHDIILVLDDFHCIADSAVLDSFEFFLRNAGSNLHIILLTRQEPPIYMSGMSMDASLLLIDDRDLRLTMDESLGFLQQTMGLKHDKEILESMAELAEGWVGGLQLITAAFRTNGENFDNLKLSNRLIGDYITKEIFEHLSVSQQDFMVRTSPMSYFCKEVCEYIFRDVDFDIMIDSLDNMLILCIDQPRGIYRYHNILGEFLKSRFRKYEKTDQALIHQKAASAFAELGDYDESLKHLLATKDFNTAIELILSLPPGARMMSYTGIVPVSAAINNYDFAYQKFFYHYLNLEFDICREISAMMKSNRYTAFEGLDFLISNEPIDLSITLPTIEEIENLHMGTASKAFILIKNATMLYYQSRYNEGLEFISKAFSIPGIAQNSFISYFAYNTQAQIYEGLGYLNQALLLYEKKRELLKKNSSMKGLYLSFYIGITGVNIKQMQLEQASVNLASAKTSARNVTDWNWFQQSYDYNIAEYLLSIGDEEGAIEIIHKLIMELTRSNFTIFSRLIRYALKIGYKPTALLESFVHEHELSDNISLIGDSHLLFVQLAIIKKDDMKALKYLDDILAQARKERVYLKIVEASLMKLGILLKNEAAKRDIINLCCEAIHFAYDDRIMLPFYLDRENIVFVDTHYGRELRNSLSDSELQFYLEMLKKWGSNDNCTLSTREKEVLHELSSGYSNKEIADHLCISVATVKSHIINIYGKLQVNSRMAAAKAARELGLLICTKK